MSKLRLLPIVALLAFGAGCEALGLFGSADSPEITSEADKLVKSGDLPAAHDKYEEIWNANQSSVYAAMGLAYSHYLKESMVKRISPRWIRISWMRVWVRSCVSVVR